MDGWMAGQLNGEELMVGGDRHTDQLSYSDKSLSEDQTLIKYLWILMH